MLPLIGQRRWCAHCTGRHDRRGSTAANPDRDKTGGLPLRTSGAGLDPVQLELALEDMETTIAGMQAQIVAVEDRTAARVPDPEKRKPRAPRKARALPEHLPRVERLVEPENIVCPCGTGDMVRIGEDRTERPDYTPASYQVIVTVRPRYACTRGARARCKPRPRRICWRAVGPPSPS